jgi:cbb3-type cytochrome oxidase subunit 3
MYNNTAIAFFFFFVIFIVIWIFALGGSVKEMRSLNTYEEYSAIIENDKASEVNKLMKIKSAGGEQVEIRILNLKNPDLKKRIKNFKKYPSH